MKGDINMLNKKYFEVMSREEEDSFVVGVYKENVNWYSKKNGKWVEDSNGRTRGIKVFEAGKEKLFVDDEVNYSLVPIDFEILKVEKLASQVDLITADYEGYTTQFHNSDFKGRYRYDFKG